VRVTVSAPGASATRTVAPYRGELVEVPFKRPADGRVVRVTVTDGSGLSASRQMTLIPYSAAAGGPRPTLSDSAGVHVASATDFVSSSGEAGILSACYASVPCHFQESLLIAGRSVGRATRVLGAGELGYVGVQLDPAGRAMLSRAAGNRVAATVSLGVHGRRRTSHIDLVRYS
jgi:hypothetical protein